MQIFKRLLTLGITGLFLLVLCGTTTNCRLVEDLNQPNACHEVKWGYDDRTFDQYSAGPNLLKTPKGVIYDPSGPFSAQLLDRVTDEVDNCLKAANLPGVNRGTFVVKIARDWVLSCNMTSYGGEQQMLPVNAPEVGCTAKGLAPDPKCPCRWRAGIKCPNLLITPPNLYLYKDVLIRFTLTNQNPWGSPVLSKCAAPSTTGMSDGTDPKNGLK